jgi:hypothetical protein
MVGVEKRRCSVSAEDQFPSGMIPALTVSSDHDVSDGGRRFGPEKVELILGERRRPMCKGKSRPCMLLFLVAFPFFTAPARVVAQPGLLVVHPANPRYLMVKNDPDRKAVFLTGAHTWAEFQTYREETFDYEDWLSKLAGQNYNLMRGWIWEDALYRPLPYANAKDKFDLARHNASFFDRLKDRVRRAARRDLYVSVMLFQGWSVLGEGRSRVPAPWPHHPFHRDNNTNGIDGDPEQTGNGHATHTLQIPAVTRLQEAYVKPVVDELNEFDNVIWINPVAGKTKAGIIESQGGRVSFVAPLPWPAGLYMRATTANGRTKR